MCECCMISCVTIFSFKFSRCTLITCCNLFVMIFVWTFHTSLALLSVTFTVAVTVYDVAPVIIGRGNQEMRHLTFLAFEIFLNSRLFWLKFLTKILMAVFSLCSHIYAKLQWPLSLSLSLSHKLIDFHLLLKIINLFCFRLVNKTYRQ